MLYALWCFNNASLLFSTFNYTTIALYLMKWLLTCVDAHYSVVIRLCVNRAQVSILMFFWQQSFPHSLQEQLEHERSEREALVTKYNKSAEELKLAKKEVEEAQTLHSESQNKLQSLKQELDDVNQQYTQLADKSKSVCQHMFWCMVLILIQYHSRFCNILVSILATNNPSSSNQSLKDILCIISQE